MLFVHFVIACVFCIVSTEKFDPKRNSLLLYLDKIRDEGLAGKSGGNIPESSVIVQECKERKYNFSVYYRVVYHRICENVSKPGANFDQLCTALRFSNYTSENNDLRQIYGPGIQSENRLLALQSCEKINGYYRIKKRNKWENESLASIYPRYSEWLVHSVPFGLPVACGFTEEDYKKKDVPPSTADCLPPSYKWGLYIMFLVDGLIILTIIVANILVLAVSVKTKMIFNTHGQLRSSLAVADLLTALVICGCINTTRTVYFSPHKFTDNQNPISLSDYHTQSYVDGFGVTTVTALAASVFSLVAISVDRFIAVFRPLVYKVYVGKIKCCTSAVIMFVWILSLALAFCPIFIPSIPYRLTALGVIIAPNFYLAYVIGLGGSLACIWILNLWMFVSLRRHQVFGEGGFKTKIINPDAPSSGERKQSKTSFEVTSLSGKIVQGSPSLRNKNAVKKKEKKPTELVLTKTVRIIVLAFSIAIIPSILVMVFGISNALEPNRSEFDPIAKAVWNSLAYIASRILFSNSFVNCLIYSYQSSKFRKAAKSLLSLNCVISNRATFNVFAHRASPVANPSFRMTSSVKSVQETTAK